MTGLQKPFSEPVLIFLNKRGERNGCLPPGRQAPQGPPTPGFGWKPAALAHCPPPNTRTDCCSCVFLFFVVVLLFFFNPQLWCDFDKSIPLKNLTFNSSAVFTDICSYPEVFICKFPVLTGGHEHLHQRRGTGLAQGS